MVLSPSSTPTVLGWYEEDLDFWNFGNDMARRLLAPLV